MDAVGGDRVNDSARHYQLRFKLLYFLGIRKVVMTMRRRLFSHMMGMPVAFLTNSPPERSYRVLPMILSRSRLLPPAR